MKKSHSRERKKEGKLGRYRKEEKKSRRDNKELQKRKGDGKGERKKEERKSKIGRRWEKKILMRI